MPGIIPSANLTRESFAELRRRILEDFTAQALRYGLAREASQLVIRDGLPGRDFGLPAQGRTSPLEAGQSQPFITARLEQSAALFYWAVLRSAEPAVGKLEFRAGDYPLASISLDPLYPEAAAASGPACPFRAGLFSDPVIYGPHQQIRILVKARRSQHQGEHLSLGSLIAEPLPTAMKLVVPYLPKPLSQLPHIEEIAWQELALELGEAAAEVLRQGGAYLLRGSNGHHYAVDGSGTLFNLTRGRQYCIVLDQDEELPRADVILTKIRWCSKDADRVEAVKNEVGPLDLLSGLPLYYGPGTEERRHADRHRSIPKAIWHGLEAWTGFRLECRGWRRQ